MPEPGAPSPYRIAMLAAAGGCAIFLAIDQYTARGLGLTSSPACWILGAASGALLLGIAVRAARPGRASVLAWIVSFGVLLVAAVLGLRATGGLVGDLVVSGLEGGTTLVDFVRWELEGLEGRRLARQRFADGEHHLLGFSMSEVFLAGAVHGGRRCQVLYIDQPTEDQREALAWPHGRYPERPPCIGPGLDAVACVGEDGEVQVLSAKILIAGCIIDGLGASYNHQMTSLLLADATPAAGCGLDASWELPAAESHLGSFVTFD